MSNKKMPVLRNKIFNKTDEVHQYVQLENFTGNPACVMFKYQWYEKIFLNKRVCVCNSYIKQTKPWMRVL